MSLNGIDEKGQMVPISAIQSIARLMETHHASFSRNLRSNQTFADEVGAALRDLDRLEAHRTVQKMKPQDRQRRLELEELTTNI